MPKCPECGSSKTWKNGLRYQNNEAIQTYRCKICGYRFSETPNNATEQTGSRQICVPLTEGMKNLTKVEIEQNRQRRTHESNLINFSWYLKKLGRSEATIKTYTNYVKNISKLGELNDPESVKGVIATHYTDKNTQRMACCSYDAYLKYVGGQWEKPSYRPEHKTVFIPSEKELYLATNTGHKESVVYSKFLYETGARTNEAQRVELTDLDIERNKVTIKASKNGDSRIIPISKNLMDLLLSLPKDKETVFTERPRNSRSSAFHNRMLRLSKIHDNPRLAKIHLHTFRHCKALREYHKTRDILHVMTILGHRKIDTTYRYVRLYNQVYKNENPDQFVTKIASNQEERFELFNNGWSKVGEDGNDWYFRKPKDC